MRAVDGLDFEIAKGETLGLVGESGSGKTTTSRLLVKLLEPTAGDIAFEGESLADMDGARLRAFRGKVPDRLPGPGRLAQPAHDRPADRRRAAGRGRHVRAGAAEPGSGSCWRWSGSRPTMRTATRTSSPAARGSGSASPGPSRPTPPSFLCDEPVSALDLSIQAQIVNLLQDLQRELGLTMLFVAHDLSVIRHVSDRVCRDVSWTMAELAPTDRIFGAPRHPYTRLLLASAPR